MQAVKKAVNLRIANDLIVESKAYKINMSSVLEETLRRLLKEKKEQAWQEQNREAIADYNFRVEKSGVFSDDLRKF